MKSVLILSLSLLTLGVSAQSLQMFDSNSSTPIANNGVVQLVTTPTTNIKFTIDIKNTSNDTIRVVAKRYDYVLNPGADAYFCFAGQCYGPQTIQSPDTLTLLINQLASEVPGAFQVLVSDLDEPLTVGYSQIRYTFFNANNPSDSVQANLVYNLALGLNDVRKNVKSVGLFPNPSEGNSSLLVNAVSAFNGKVMIYNSLGDLISVQNANLVQGENKIELNLNGLSAGVYLVSLKTDKSNLTKRLIIK